MSETWPTPTDASPSSVGPITAEAAPNIAFVKYWGALDLERAIPVNPSISMTLSCCRSVCTAEHYPESTDDDEILLVSEKGGAAPAPPEFRERIAAQLDRLRQAAGAKGRFRIATRNNFPSAAGIASSASGFAALTLAGSRALGLDLDSRELSILTQRSGSGSASRSVLGGYVEWPAGEGSDQAYAMSLAEPETWDLRDVIAVVDTSAKKVSSLEGHRRAPSSPYYQRRQELLPERLATVRQAIRDRDLDLLGPVVEEEAIDLHLIAMSSRPPIFYWKPPTLAVLERLRQLRRDGVPAYGTMDAGANVHVLCLPDGEDTVVGELAQVTGVERLLRDRVGGPPVWRPGAEL